VTLSDRIRGVIDPRPAQQRPRALRNGLIALALLALGTYMALARDIPFIGPSATTVRADFPFANQVQVNGHTPVRVGGVKVGEVRGLGPGADPRRSTRVTMRITDHDLVVHDDARAELRWRTILGGQMYVDLQPGSPSAPRLGDGVIPVSRTSSQVEFDDLLRTYDGGVDNAQRGVIRGLAAATSDPAATGSAIDALPDLTTVGRGLDAMRGTEAGDLRGLVASTGKVVQSLGTDTDALQRLVDGADRTLGATAAKRAELGRTLQQSPASLDATTATMARLRRTLGHLDPTVASLQPGARRVAASAAATAPALDQLRAVLREAKPVLVNARPALRSLRGVSQSGVPLVQHLEPTVDRVNDQLLGWLDKRDSDTRLRNFEAIGPFFSSMSSAASQYDTAGFRLRLGVIPPSTNSLITTATPGNNTNLQSAFATDIAQRCKAARRIGCGDLAKLIVRGIIGGVTGR
jgi:virulence factor Mce-like protein